LSSTKNNYRSKFESNVAALLRKRGVTFEYEPEKFPFVQPAINRKYTPDFKLLETGTYVECKGKLTSEERKKLLWWREAYPDVRFILIFMRARNTIRKGSKTTYAQWATDNGFEWIDWEQGIPKGFK
jgi:hypothetical protein